METRNFLLSVLIAVLAGSAAIFEKVSLKEATPLTVFTIRSLCMTLILIISCFVLGNIRPLFQVSGRTLLFILIPAVLATSFIALYFSILRNDLASRVFPILSAAPLVTVILSVIFLGEPLTWRRIVGAGLVVLGVSLVK